VAEGIPGRIGRVRLKSGLRVMSEEDAVNLLSRGLYPRAFREEIWLGPDLSPEEVSEWTIIMTEEQMKAEEVARALYASWREFGYNLVEPA
jgi:hypothetical protein